MNSGPPRYMVHALYGHLYLKIHLTSSSLYHESASAKNNNTKNTLKISNAGSLFWK